MKRRIINIDESKCNGCGACANACHEGAIAMVNGKAKLMRDDFCDGLGDCLPACRHGARLLLPNAKRLPTTKQRRWRPKKAKQQQSGRPSRHVCAECSGASLRRRPGSARGRNRAPAHWRLSRFAHGGVQTVPLRRLPMRPSRYPSCASGRYR